MNTNDPSIAKAIFRNRRDRLSKNERTMVEYFRNENTSTKHWTVGNEIVEILDRLAPRPEGQE